MNLLLDTHIALWAIADDPRLSSQAKDLIADPANEVFVSAASVWEIAIKHALARDHVNDMPISGQTALGYFREAGFTLLDISAAHAAAVETLPLLHADPFDRILLGQARSVPLRLLTQDGKLAAYSDSVLLA